MTINHKIMVTAKRDGEVLKQSVLSNHIALNLARRCILRVHSTDETVADLLAIDFLNTLDSKPLGITNGDTTLVFQIAPEKTIEQI